MPVALTGEFGGIWNGGNMKTKIVEHIASNARFELCQARGEAVNMCDKYRELKNTTDNGIGLDMAVLREHLENAEKLISLLI